MHLVTLDCRECDTEIEFASNLNIEEPTLNEMQTHMDTMFVARCGGCFACDWEVTSVQHMPEEWSVEPNVPIMLTVPDWMLEAEKSAVN